MDFSRLRKVVDDDAPDVEEPVTAFQSEVGEEERPPAASGTRGAPSFAGVRFGGDDGRGMDEPTPQGQRSSSSGALKEPLVEIECDLHSNKGRNEKTRFQKFSARMGRKYFELMTNWVVPLRAGESIKAQGRWKDDKTFWAESYEIVKPQDTLGVRKWLGGGAVAGVSGRTADHIVEKYGAEAASYLGDAVALEAAGIPKSRATAIADAYLANMRESTVSMHLLGLGLGYSQVAEIMDTYGLAAPERVKNTPWDLAGIDGVSFQTADSIALSMGRSEVDVERIVAGMHYALKEATDKDGHSGVKIDDFVKRTMRVLKIDPPVVRAAVPAFLKRDDVVVENDVVSRVVDRKVEKTVAYDVARIARSAEPYSIEVAEDAVARAEAIKETTLDESQRRAAVTALMHPFSIITGGPGVGKSTTLKVVVEALAILGETPRLSAPTGRASKRMAEVSGLEASTIHRLLKFDGASRSGFVFHRRNALPAGRYIVDETSMMDVKLTRSFLQAVPNGSRVILVGDVDQLPSVGAGQVLRDVIDSGKVPVSRLTKIHRQGNDSGIVQAAYRVNAGVHLEPVANDRGFCFIDADDDSYILKGVLRLVSDTLKKYDYDPRTDVQVLAAVRGKGIGVDLLNREIKKRINPGEAGDGRSVEHAGRVLSVGDRVIHNKNRHKIGVYNGDVGYVVSAEQEDKTLRVVVEYSDQQIEYVQNQLYDIELCYATTIHKSQGSEYPVAIVLVPMDHSYSLNRNLIYTAITRAKERCFVIGTEQTVREAVDDVKSAMRTTSLAKDVIAEFDSPSLLAQIEPSVEEDECPEDEPEIAVPEEAPVEEAERELQFSY